MKISIIIPVFNTEKYLKRCLYSCIHQDLNTIDFEIIIINDGSTDNSLQIAKDFARDRTNVFIHSQNNAGLSEARNSGLKIARGDYLLFLDSDDWLAENCLKRIVEEFDSGIYDLVKIGACDVFGDIVVRRYSLEEGRHYSGMDLLMKGIDYCVPFTIYRRSFIEAFNLSFMPGVFHEDNEFTPRAYYHAQRVGCINDIVYYVYHSPNSITRSINPQKAYDAIIVSESLSAFSSCFIGKPKKIFDRIIGSTINVSLHNCLNMSSDEIYEYKSFLLLHLNLFRHLRESDSLMYRVEGLLMSHYPKFIPEIYKILQVFDFRKLKDRLNRM